MSDEQKQQEVAQNPSDIEELFQALSDVHALMRSICSRVKTLHEAYARELTNQHTLRETHERVLCNERRECMKAEQQRDAYRDALAVAQDAVVKYRPHWASSYTAAPAQLVRILAEELGRRSSKALTNKNCLANMQCSRCMSEGPFFIETLTTATVYDDGVEDHGDMDWHDDSVCTCAHCNLLGTVADFKVKPKKG